MNEKVNKKNVKNGVRRKRNLFWCTRDDWWISSLMFRWIFTLVHFFYFYLNDWRSILKKKLTICMLSSLIVKTSSLKSNNFPQRFRRRLLSRIFANEDAARWACFFCYVPHAVAVYRQWIGADRDRRMSATVPLTRNDCHHQLAHSPSVETSRTDKCPRNILQQFFFFFQIDSLPSEQQTAILRSNNFFLDSVFINSFIFLWRDFLF